MKNLYLLVLLPSLAFAETSFDLTGSSAYFWRGLVLDEDPVLQPALNAEHGPLVVNAWANHDFDQFNEVDLSASLAHEIGPVSVELGVLQYLYPYGEGETWEVTGSVSWEFLALSLYRDVDLVNGLYGVLSANHEWKGFEGSLWLGYGDDKNNAYSYADNAGLTDTGVQLGYPVEWKQLTITPGGAVMQNLFDERVDAALQLTISASM